MNKGYALGKLKRFEEEGACYDRALSMYPFYYSALSNKAITLLNQKRYSDVLEVLDQVLAIDRGSAKGLYRKGLALAMLGRHEEAIENFKRSLEITPSNADAWVVLSNSIFMLGNPRRPVRGRLTRHTISIFGTSVQGSSGDYLS